MAKPVDWATEERKLQSVYDDVLGGRLKPAREAIDRWLKKHPKSQPALVMRMVLLEKTGSGVDTVLAAYEQVKRTAPFSGRSVWWISLTLRNVGRPDLVLALYTELWEARPEIVELGEQVFLHAAAVNDVDTMMASSRKVFNLTKSPIWARLAAFSQVTKHTPPPTESTPFPLAPPKSLLPASLLLRASGPLPPSSSILWLALRIALASGDAAEAAKLIRTHGERGGLVRQWVVMQATEAVSATKSVEGWDEESFERALKVIQTDEEAQRNYAFYQHLQSRLALVPSSENTAKVRSALTKLYENIGAKERAPSLALLEMGEAEEGTVQRYWSKWGSKGSAVSEVEGVVKSGKVKNEDVESVLAATVKAGHSDLKSYLSLLNAELYLLRQSKPTPMTELASKWWSLYTSGLEYGLNLPKTDVQYADEAGLVAVQVLVALWAKEKSEDALVQAVICAEYILSKSPSAHARFLLIRLYRLLGTPQLSSAHLDAMKVSEIMLDTLSYPWLERGAVEAYLTTEGRKVWEKTTEAAGKMYKRSASELPEYIKQALENESYNKVHEIQALVDALDTSISARILQIETLLYSTMSGSEFPLHVVNAISSALSKEVTDNRSYELLPDSAGLGMKTLMNPMEVSEAWVKALGWMTVRLAKWSVGEAYTEDMPNTDELTKSEIALVNALNELIKPATSNGSTETTSESGSAEYPVASVFSPNLQLCLQDPEGSLHPFLVLILLARSVQVVSKRVNQMLQVPKGKKRDPALVLVQQGIKAAQAALKEKKEEVVAKLERKEVKAVQGFFEDEIKQKIVGDIEKARGEVKDAMVKALLK